MKISLIGSSKIASIHLRILLNINENKKIYLISRDLKKANKLIKEINNDNLDKVYPSKINVLKKTKLSLIDICVKTNLHHVFLEKINSKGAIVFVEKPLLNPLKIKGDIINYIQNLYNRHKKLIICYPYSHLASSVKNILPKEKIKNISFKFLTKGKNHYNSISYDLMPHAYVFICKLLNIKKLKINEKTLIKKITKNSWSLKFTTTNKIKINIELEENKNFLETNLHFIVNNRKIVRETETKNGKFNNYLIYKKNKFNILNPMDQFINNLYKNKNKKNYFEENKKMTINLYDFHNTIDKLN